MFSMCGPADRGRGPWINSQKNGLGKQTWPNGDEYLGMWAQHKPEGKGKYSWNGARKEYLGEWKAGESDGSGKLETFGVVPPQTGQPPVAEYTYEGEWSKGKANGYGIRVEANGSAYHGHWKDDLQDGPGIEITRDDEKEVKWVYTGEFQKGKRHGYGDIYWAGQQGKVEIVDTEHGSEQVYVAERYQGQWAENMMSGFGVCVWPDREYKGQWENNLMHGFGVHTWLSDRAFVDDKATLVKGSWKNDKTFTGWYVKGKKDHGVLDFGDGRKYDGEFKAAKDGKDMMHGTGKYTNGFLAAMASTPRGGAKEFAEEGENGEMWTGEWVEGRHVRWTDGHSDNVVRDLTQAEQCTVNF